MDFCHSSELNWLCRWWTRHWGQCKGSRLTNTDGKARRQQFGLASWKNFTQAVSTFLAVVLENFITGLGKFRDWRYLIQYKLFCYLFLNFFPNLHTVSFLRMMEVFCWNLPYVLAIKQLYYLMQEKPSNPTELNFSSLFLHSYVAPSQEDVIQNNV